ncbi:hypothetical protein [Nostoc sp.]|uniref:hypothetical protein n=1 Tax=Nostoc sp. TaxID=1180 RepID=UPI002FF5F6F2
MAIKNPFDKCFEDQEDKRQILITEYKRLNYKFRYKLELFTYFSPFLIDIIQPTDKKLEINKEGFLTLNLEALFYAASY